MRQGIRGALTIVSEGDGRRLPYYIRRGELWSIVLQVSLGREIQPGSGHDSFNFSGCTRRREYSKVRFRRSNSMGTPGYNYLYLSIPMSNKRFLPDG